MRECLRDWFTQLGRPQSLRVDNGSPWGSRGELPTDLALWLIGLGVRMIWNPPCQPQKNGVVERSQGTGKRWSEPFRCRTACELQRHIDEMDAIHLAEYQVADGRTRLELFPELAHSGAPYRRETELSLWSWDRVAEFLAPIVTPRKIDSSGNVTIYERSHYVGRAYRGQTVYTAFDPSTCEWIFRDEHDNQLRTKPAAELQPKSILALNVTYRRGDR